MQMKVNSYNLEGTQHTTYHGQIDGFLKNWGGKKTRQIQVQCLTASINYLLLEIDFKVNC